MLDVICSVASSDDMRQFTARLSSTEVRIQGIFGRLTLYSALYPHPCVVVMCRCT